ncbi:AAA family ATPase [Acetobacter sp. LMG 1627]|uniref:AAA family ATPase n=1 Tax=Acetobacter conturbans TaxID=1737472 RepID=A0ABX0JXY4_9PROT|nr:AAA family ATPase [Acetobacter conturbans]
MNRLYRIGTYVVNVSIVELKLKDIAGFRNFIVSFQSNLNIICGTNGVGKTTILEAVSSAFSPNIASPFLKRRSGAAGENPGYLEVDCNINHQIKKISGNIKETLPDKNSDYFGHREGGNFVIFVRAVRDFAYARHNSITADPDMNDMTVQQRTVKGISPHEIKSWFANRYLMRPHGNDWPEYRKKNLEAAINLFSRLDPTVKLSHVDTSSFDIIVNTQNGNIAFEMLSSGFRSAFSLLLGIIKEIEFRRLNLSVDEFNGVILIDEIDLHLHPIWQREIGGALKSTFPKAQIIATTHSPHVIQTALPNEVIALARDADGNTFVRDLPISKRGFVGWSIEEILTEIMGVEDTQTPEYRIAMKNFDNALDRNDEQATTEAYNILLEMLHPSNPLRKLLEIQSSKATGVQDD